MKRVPWIVLVVLIPAAYLVGFVPEYRRGVALEADVQTTRAELVRAQAQVRLGAVLGQSLQLSNVVTNHNYGLAGSLASAFFDRVGAEATASDEPDVVKGALTQILQTRDAVTAAIARNDPAVLGILAGHQKSLRQALGYAIPTAATPPGRP